MRMQKIINFSLIKKHYFTIKKNLFSFLFQKTVLVIFLLLDHFLFINGLIWYNIGVSRLRFPRIFLSILNSYCQDKILKTRLCGVKFGNWFNNTFIDIYYPFWTILLFSFINIKFVNIDILIIEIIIKIYAIQKYINVLLIILCMI